MLERFSITRRGTVVVLDGVIDLPIGRPLSARVTRPDGSHLDAVAFKEWLLRSGPTPIENEAFLLMSVDKVDVPEGSLVTITL